MSLYLFNKEGFTDESHILRLYDRKIKLLLGGREEDRLSPRDAEILFRLRYSRRFDPRFRFVLFGSEEVCKQAMAIAENLDRLTDREFLISSYPYEWTYDVDHSALLLTEDPQGQREIGRDYSHMLSGAQNKEGIMESIA